MCYIESELGSTTPGYRGQFIDALTGTNNQTRTTKNK